MISVDLWIPQQKYPEFKNKVLKTNFESDEPAFIYHRQDLLEDFEYSTFRSDCMGDICHILDMLPVGSEFSKILLTGTDREKYSTTI